ncbi:Sporulation-specific protein 6 [Smittium mucronatum]|uniref:Sporulation-specific protein 6 n=1 Tax=Smittium mucronatum TaxID=133383 RepID=A0A1R0H550_9FUNG|nr:Sporulation-specific protein 6 [Smittium mucronatum]
MANRKLHFQTSLSQRVENNISKQPEFKIENISPAFSTISGSNTSSNSNSAIPIQRKTSIMFDSSRSNYHRRIEPATPQRKFTSSLAMNILPRPPQIQSSIASQNILDSSSLKIPNNCSQISPHPAIKIPINDSSQSKLPITDSTPSRSKDVQRAKLQEWVVAYRTAFPSFHFYFDDINENLKRNLSASVKTLAATVESFFSVNEVTHVIVSDETSLLISKGKLSSVSNVVLASQKFNVKIWSVDKLQNRILRFLLPSHQNQNLKNNSILGKRNLSEIIQAEKMSTNGSNSNNGSSGINFYYFKHNYVLAEDSSYMFKPILMNDYKNPEEGCDYPWPKLYYVPKGRCPFIKYDHSTSEKDSDSDSGKEELSVDDSQSQLDSIENNQSPRKKKKKDFQEDSAIIEVMGDERSINNKDKELLRAVGSTMIVDSVASGANATPFITSTSTISRQFPTDRISQKTLVSSVQKNRVDQLSRLEQPITPDKYYSNPNNINSSVTPSERKVRNAPRFRIPNTAPVGLMKKKTPSTRQPAASRPGYCENCKAKYEDMLEHIQSSSHRSFASTASNWVELDNLLNSVQRKFISSPSVEDDNVQTLSYMINSNTRNNHLYNFMNYNSNDIKNNLQKRTSYNDLNASNTQSNIKFLRGVNSLSNINGTLDNPITIFESSARSSSDNSPLVSNGINQMNQRTTQVPCFSQIFNATPSWESNISNDQFPTNQIKSDNRSRNDVSQNLGISGLTHAPIYNTPMRQYQNEDLSTYSSNRTISSILPNSNFDWYKNSNTINRNSGGQPLNIGLQINDMPYNTPVNMDFTNNMSSTVINSRVLRSSNENMVNMCPLGHQTPTKIQIGNRGQLLQQHLTQSGSSLFAAQQTKSWSSAGDNLSNFNNGGPASWATGISPSVSKIIHHNDNNSSLGLDVDGSTSY